MNRNMRNTVKGLAVIYSCLFLLVLCGGIPGSASAGDDNELVIQTWGGAKTTAEKHAFYDPFTEETGIKITLVEAGGDAWGKVAAQIKSGNIEWDLVSGYPYASVKMAADKGLIEEIDYSVVTDTKDLIPGSVKKWGLGQELNAVILAYNKNKWPGDNHPKSWADFFDVEKFPGPRAMSNWGAGDTNLVCALLAAGVDPDNLVPIDYDRAFKKLDQIRSSTKVWYTSGDQLMQALQSEEVVLAQVWDGRAKAAIQNGAPVELVWNQGVFQICYWNIVKGAPNKKAALQFLNFINRPEQQAIFSNYIWYSSANPKSVNFLPPAVHKQQAVYPANFKQLIPVPNEKTAPWLNTHNAELNEKFDSWLMQ